MKAEEDALRAELEEFYSCRHESFGTYVGEVRIREIERRLFGIKNRPLAERYANTVRIDQVLGDIPETPPPRPEPGTPGRWDWMDGEEDPTEWKRS
jgi:hypothetical protein